MISSLCRGKQEFERQYLAGELELEFVPQGTLAENCDRRRRGHPVSPKPVSARWSPKAKKPVIFDGETYLMERALTADVALIKAWKADQSGNLIYRRTARNFNQWRQPRAKSPW